MTSPTLETLLNDLNKLFEQRYHSPRHPGTTRREKQQLGQLHKRGITTATDLVRELPVLSPSLKSFGIDLCYRLNLRNSLPVLWQVMESSPSLRPMCGWVISSLKPDGPFVKRVIRIGSEQLRSPHPDPTWLAAVIQAATDSDSLPLTQLLVEIFEREDLPGRIRGDAADKLGCFNLLQDRRTGLYRRARDAAIRGLKSPSIEVQFGCMYLIGALCSNQTTPSRLRSNRRDFNPAIPLLKEIAANDHRLSPGYWWPMSAEAEDILVCINTGQWPHSDAAERHLHSGGPHGPREKLANISR